MENKGGGEQSNQTADVPEGTEKISDDRNSLRSCVLVEKASTLHPEMRRARRNRGYDTDNEPLLESVKKSLCRVPMFADFVSASSRGFEQAGLLTAQRYGLYPTARLRCSWPGRS
jgi:hypothetical protein